MCCLSAKEHCSLSQAKYPGVTIASFDTTDERLEAAAADVGIKALPAFKFYNVSLLVLSRAFVFTRQLTKNPPSYTRPTCVGRQGGAGPDRGL